MSAAMYASLSYRSSILLILMLNIFIYIVAAPAASDHGYGFLRLMYESFEDSTTTKLNHTVSHYILADDDIPVDVKDIAREDNGDVVLFGTGRIDLIMEDEALGFEVWQTCSGASKVCYKSDPIEPYAAGLCLGLTSYCGFDVSKRDEDPHHLKINKLSIEVDDGGHLSYNMSYNKVKVQDLQYFASCTPKYGQGKMVELYSYATRTCEITVKNAKIALPPQKTISTSLNVLSTETLESANFFATTWGFVVIALLAVLFVFILLGVTGYFIGKKMNFFKSRKPARVEEAIHQAKPDVVIVEGKKKAAKAQPRMDSKIDVKEAPVKKMMAEKPKMKNAVNAPKNAEAKPPKAIKESPLKTAVEECKPDRTQESSKLDDAPPPVIDENDYDENEVGPPPPPATAPPPSRPVPPPARPHPFSIARPPRRSNVPEKNRRSKKMPQSPTKRYDNGQPYVQTPFKMFVRSGGSKKDSLCEKSGYF